MQIETFINTVRALGATHSIDLVKISGRPIVHIQVVPAEGDEPGYIDLVEG